MFKKPSVVILEGNFFCSLCLKQFMVQACASQKKLVNIREKSKQTSKEKQKASKTKIFT
jgi:hypothetical protein